MVEIGTLSRSGIVTKIYPLTALALELSKPDDAKASASTEAANSTVGTSKKRYADRRGSRNHGQREFAAQKHFSPRIGLKLIFAATNLKAKGTCNEFRLEGTALGCCPDYYWSSNILADNFRPHPIGTGGYA
ncbi:hypothetical protein GAO09_10360 [Rhizobiales bacterium RZME27]|uniref:Uncharacterized protein n=1 Tax=Endobacterium cereale TaxID=2663029 RepID=A0A6A8A989_9HYPH|nr:hypothetical protein [Endobacterium cereale]MEB2846627.1 hypothetical protein [Endobacterium cereale]MQY46447.1 hypothetical protein [Endobacterium cereale]